MTFSIVALMLGGLVGLAYASPKGGFESDLHANVSRPLIVPDTKFCEPDGDFKLGTSRAIPPCVAENLIYSECRKSTKAWEAPSSNSSRIAFRDCLFGSGSSMERDIMGCVQCKYRNHIYSLAESEYWSRELEQHIEEYKRLSPPLEEFPWGLFRQMDLSLYPKNAHPPGNLTRVVTLEEYYPDPPKLQRAGLFNLSSSMDSHLLSIAGGPGLDGTRVLQVQRPVAR